MLGENLAALMWLYARPVAAISRILDRGRLWFAVLAALAVSILVHIGSMGADLSTLAPGPPRNVHAKAARNKMERAAKQAPSQEPEAGDEVEEPRQRIPDPSALATGALARFSSFESGFFTSVWTIAVLLVPAMIAARAVSGYGSFGVLMRQDYLSMVMCTLMAWTAAYLPVAAILGAVFFATGGHSSAHVAPLFIAASVYFLALTALAARTNFGVTAGPAARLVAIAAAIAIVVGGLFGVIGFSLYYLASPFYLFYAWRLVGSDVRSLGDGLRMRQHLRNQLEIATNNPRDADAHYQLGLMYQKRRQFAEAIARFQRAVEIDPKEPEPHFQLGCIAREQGRFEDAIRHLSTAAALNDKLQQHDVWRELGAAYLGANRLEEARAALAKYVTRREYDPEGLYWYGIVLKRAGQANEARELFQHSIDSVKSMPSHRRAELRSWGAKAKKEL